ncbi:PREDICTED: uncharacterized protein LOC104816815 isoform X1 [Tarenaya hassleriana]|uniref:uncharacterized protein LOC104816815 isoform X1 n=1 Tax=Tarenaya hassleriana TaxID=28532 RepID=UPI00053C656B|nr:PREDICTED: uncharacterized protein LOC104816815 isoform X1 [Tarenaya hassleriana]
MLCRPILFLASKLPVEAQRQGNLKFEQRGERERLLATTAKNLKDVYRQKESKVTGGISKPKPSSRKVSLKHSGTQGSDVTQPAALISHGLIDLDDKNEGIRHERGLWSMPWDDQTGSIGARSASGNEPSNGDREDPFERQEDSSTMPVGWSHLHAHLR